MAQVIDNKVVIFADVLGFAALTEAHSINLDHIKAFDMPGSLGGVDKILASQDNPLSHVFAMFHYLLHGALDLAKMRHPLTAITFSDSAFIATAHLFEAANVAASLLQYLLPARVPIRIGIAHGTFEAVRFRSDITFDGGDHAAHFLGTAVVRAHATEKCGIKGIRVLLHPSAVRLLDNPIHNPELPDKDRLCYLECSEDESNNSAGVRLELDYWRFGRTAEATAWRALQDMWNAAPPSAVRHYQATAEAINRMRMGRGEPAMSSFRRRTLPRRRVSQS